MRVEVCRGLKVSELRDITEGILVALDIPTDIPCEKSLQKEP